MTSHLASILAQIHLHIIPNQHIWNSLVFNPILPYITSLCMVFMLELTVKMGQIILSTTPYYKQVQDTQVARTGRRVLCFRAAQTSINSYVFLHYHPSLNAHPRESLAGARKY